MNLLKMNCPNCGAMLDVEDGIDMFYCRYCGSKIVLDGQSDAAYNAKSQVKQSEHKVEMLKAKLKHEENMQKQDNEDKAKNSRFLWVIFMLLILIFSLPFSCSRISSSNQVKNLEKTVEEIQELIDNGEYDEALIKADSIRYTENYSSDEEEAWNARRETLINLIKSKMAEDSSTSGVIVIANGSDNYMLKNYLDVEESFKEMGFKDVSIKQLNEKPGIFDNKESVQKITINGDDSFDENDIFNKESKVVIYIYKQ